MVDVATACVIGITFCSPIAENRFGTTMANEIPNNKYVYIDAWPGRNTMSAIAIAPSR